ncbi:aldehyde dehydrogenase (NADP(+)) [Chitinophaga horti]|uniref:Aldehyde dehydrogenase (NADP(+)) n=1 Tax=Chitinophaga horti TaxID=2920382 RepID=A0ABY6J9J4_9BACT|nr:aldehyde dehydrogenase (NADP(+)) [Chitinophaga horti]UYQ94839.1 aldehyde dehydrogenase (NADP(+)) [Chitinophaga horti]
MQTPVTATTNVEEVMDNAAKAFDEYKRLSAARRADFLEAIAQELEAAKESLVAAAHAETNLPLPRLNGEVGRTTGQLRLFANLLREGSWVNAVIDTADPSRTPARPDLRKMSLPLGPVAVFSASNFPFAFSTAGGDTASALAAGCPVVVKGHSAHLQTSLLVFEAMQKAIKAAGVPEFTIQHITGPGNQVGKALVQHPAIAAVGFTGSFSGGTALVEYSSQRAVPVPVFAEMSSINPVVLFPDALKQQGAQLAQTYAGSITLGMGQFCTNPGLLLAVKSAELDQFVGLLAEDIAKVAPAKMLHSGICKSYHHGLEEVLSHKDVELVKQSAQAPADLEAYPTLARVTGAAFLADAALREEVFGPFSLVVVCENKAELVQVLKSLKGQLTTTLMATPTDIQANRDILDLQATLAGRIILNAAPTGVEVCAAMVHGGPFPATTDARFTSVGSSAIQRWVRPVCFQGFTDDMLPEELQNANPLNIWRNVNNQLTQSPLNA